ncbi:MAG: Coenzyme F420 hydrogenase/dehydrogenase, beta subunit C-terminal domain [Chloroflexi bacterium]|nr:Coenzyme F420 hydrogenase/dehydrogenase, beta subunit C-terminal domain [Chloroflexota bacterium]
MTTPTSRMIIPLSPRDIVRSGLCIGCGSCVAQAAEPGSQMKLNLYGQLQPAASAAWLRGRSESFARTCPFSPAATNETQLAAALYPDAEQSDLLIGRFRTAYVGYVAEEPFREDGSSGGMVTWAATELLRKGLVDGVAHVVASNNPRSDGKFFRYRISRTEEEVRAGAKSRYYPVELSEVIRTIRAVAGRYAVVGIPCFIKAVHLLRQEDPVIHERVAFTLGLFCGHMKSARLIESFAWQMGVSVGDIQRVDYRLKDPSRPASWYTAHFTLRDGRTVQQEWSRLAEGDWGSGFFQHSACNFCDDVVAETADISFGDAWVEPYSSDGRGTNVVIVRSPVLATLVARAISEGRLTLRPVDEKFVEQTQAAGFRQRREGLAYRLTWHRFGVQPLKRVRPDAKTLSFRRKLIYRMRSTISAWSHRLFLVARITGRQDLYVRWANGAVTLYHGLAYSRGKIGAIVERLGLHS